MIKAKKVETDAGTRYRINVDELSAKLQEILPKLNRQERSFVRRYIDVKTADGTYRLLPSTLRILNEIWKSAKS